MYPNRYGACTGQNLTIMTVMDNFPVGSGKVFGKGWNDTAPSKRLFLIEIAAFYLYLAQHLVPCFSSSFAVSKSFPATSFNSAKLARNR